MIIFTIVVAVTIFLGALVAYMSFNYAEHKGYMRGLDEAEEIMRGCRNDNNNNA